ncbi:hypothetical protein GCM10009836_04170 [Pseudonocardia ailaonensis]|uniref:Uncharacterized protein n=1 Tax=Pseudonocardia ailaonensis TaxID=367279 RepID=A0ABN2MJE9_9PSEU
MSAVVDLHEDRRDALLLIKVLDLGYADEAEVGGCAIATTRSRVA